MHRHFLVAREKGDQGVGGFAIEDDFASRPWMVARGECPHDFFGARDVNVVVDEDVFGSTHASLHFEEALPHASTELFSSVAEFLAPVHFGGNDIPMVRALKRTPRGRDWESGLTENMH